MAEFDLLKICNTLEVIEKTHYRTSKAVYYSDLSDVLNPEHILIFKTIQELGQWSLQNIYKPALDDLAQQLEPEALNNIEAVAKTVFKINNCIVFISADYSYLIFSNSKNAEAYIQLMVKHIIKYLENHKVTDNLRNGISEDLSEKQSEEQIKRSKITSLSKDVAVQTELNPLKTKEIQGLTVIIRQKENEMTEFKSKLKVLSDEYIEQTNLWLRLSKLAEPKRRYDQFVKTRSNSLGNVKAGIRQVISGELSAKEYSERLHRWNDQHRKKKEEIENLGGDTKISHREYIARRETEQKKMQGMSSEMTSIRKQVLNLDIEIKELQRQIREIIIS